MLNLFYEEPDPDRFIPYDRYPRRWIRRLLRGAPRPGGQMRVFLNLCAGLDKIGVRYRVNDYRYARRHPDELVCIIGKPHVLDRVKWRNPIVFGASVFSHPVDDPDILQRLPVKLVLVPGEWYRRMFEPYYGDKVVAWPVGIDTERWAPASAERTTGGGKGREARGMRREAPSSPAGLPSGLEALRAGSGVGERREALGIRHEASGKKYDFLIYDKVRWEHERFEKELIEPVRAELRRQGCSFDEIRYGYYEEEDFRKRLGECRAMVFLCEHESQGIAYQQALSCGVPVLAWDRGGYWQDPTYFPERAKFEPVSSVPYWDERCGLTFSSAADFPEKLTEFREILDASRFAPRDYVLENLELGAKAREFVEIVQGVVCQKRG